MRPKDVVRKILFGIAGVFGILIAPVLFPMGYFILWLNDDVESISEEWKIYVETIKDMLEGRL